MVGTGGPQMAAAGVELLEGLNQMAVMGFAEVVKRIRFFRRLEKRIKRLLSGDTFDLVLPVDYPGLNMRIAAFAARRDIPVLYYIAPQVWAWKTRRTERLSQIADRIAVVLPFEPALYQKHGGRAVFVGHPLLDEQPKPDPDALADELGIGRGEPVLALFPGSRPDEVERHRAPFAETAIELQRRVAGLRVVVCRTPSLPKQAYRGFPFPGTEDGASLRALATAGLVKSGTSTLEAALAGMPMAVAYATHPVTWFLARRLVRVPYVSLVNWVANRKVVPEFLQREAVPSALAGALEPLLDRSARERRAMLADFDSVREALGEPGAAARVAQLAEAVLSERSKTRGPAA